MFISVIVQDSHCYSVSTLEIAIMKEQNKACLQAEQRWASACVEKQGGRKEKHDFKATLYEGWRNTSDERNHLLHFPSYLFYLYLYKLNEEQFNQD